MDPAQFTSRRPKLAVLAVLALVALAGPGCTSRSPSDSARWTPPAMPEYTRPLAPGESALRPVMPSRMPDLEAAFDARDDRLLLAIDRSLGWFAVPSSTKAYPFDGFTHQRAKASLLAMRELLVESPDAGSFARTVEARFEVYESVGYDGNGVVLFTGYYAPVFPASLTRTSRFRYPLYRRPADLESDPRTGRPLGRRTANGTIVPYPTRGEIETQELLRGTELVWLEDALSAYLVHVNGSAKLRLPDDTIMYVGYAGKTGHPYASLGMAMIDEGLLEPDHAGLSAIRAVYERRPKDVERLMQVNRSYVFFQEYGGDQWPAGSLGVPVTPESSLATDKSVYPRGGLVLVDTESVTFGGSRRPFLQFMLDQDTGGAIEAPGRADIFMGIGSGAEILAGGQRAEGRLYYFFLKPEYVSEYVGLE